MASDPPPRSSAAIAPPSTARTPFTNHSSLALLRPSNPLYPVSSSGRGLQPRPNLMRPPINAIPLPSLPHPHPKVSSSPSSAPDANGYKTMRDRSRDDSLAVVRERRVRISDGSSLYAMCRSWLKNGFHEEAKPQYMDGVKSLPRPLPIPMADASLPKRKEHEEMEEENVEPIEQLSAEDLLKGHIKRAKKVRSRLREERLQRIARYKTRLALLLPPPIEPLRNDAAAGN